MGIASVASFPRNEIGQSLITGQPLRVEKYNEVDDAPKLTPERMQKLETRYQAYKEAHSGGFWSSLGSFFSKVGGFIKDVATTAVDMAKGIVNPANWVKPEFWRDIVAPVAMNFIPGIGTVAASIYKYGMAAYKGVQAIAAAAKGKLGEAISLGIDSVSGFSNKAAAFIEKTKKTVSDTIRKVTEPVGEWVNKGRDLYQKGTDILKDWGIFG